MIVKFFFIISLFLCKSMVKAGTRINFSRCGLNGFTCVQNGTRITHIRYQCPINVHDVVIYINQVTSPATLENLEIVNCDTLTLSTRCTGESKRIQQLLVANIKHLIFQRLQYEPMLPPTVIFKNISYIQTIPFRTFAQIEKPYYSSGCYVQPVDFQRLYFQNVSIDVIESNAFVGLNQFKNFSFIDVNIKTIQTSGIKIKLDHGGLFEIKNSNVITVEYLGIQMYSRRALIVENHFTDIFPSGFNGTVEDFLFTHNSVETVHPYAFSILATNVFMLSNTFLHLRTAALEKLSPGLIQDSGRNFGKLKFVYDFSKNSLNFVDAGSLNPDYVSYENVQTEMMFSRNSFLCTCENVGWIFSDLGHGPNTAQLEPFYEIVLDESYGNICDTSFSKSCNISLGEIRQMVKCGKCLTNVSVENICENKEKVHNKETVHHKEDVQIATTGKPLLEFYDEEYPDNFTTSWNFNGRYRIASATTVYLKNYILMLITAFCFIIF